MAHRDITVAMVDAFLNEPNFPTTKLKPGQDFHSTTIFCFATDASLPR